MIINDDACPLDIDITIRSLKYKSLENVQVLQLTYQKDGKKEFLSLG
ncbi:MAG: hypothetical protein ACI9CQ_004063, partial [Saprospiraceae bacterium]